MREHAGWPTTPAPATSVHADCDLGAVGCDSNSPHPTHSSPLYVKSLRGGRIGAAPRHRPLGREEQGTRAQSTGADSYDANPRTFVSVFPLVAASLCCLH